MSCEGGCVAGPCVVQKLNLANVQLDKYVKEGKEYYLRIYIQNKNGISIEDCEKVNNAITDKLDTADYIKEQYFLEVSSCGLEQILRKEKHLKGALGKEVEVKMFKAVNGKKCFKGILNNFSQDTIEVDNILLNRKDISQIKTVYDWNNIE